MKGLYKQRQSRFFWFRFRVDGKEYRRSTGEADEARAILVARQMRLKPPIAKVSDLDAEVEKLVAGRSANYKRDSLTVLKKFSRAFAGVPVRDITTARVQAWIEGLAVKPNTREAYRFQVQLLFDALLKAGKVRTNPARGLKLATVKRSVRKHWIKRRDYPVIFSACTEPELKFVLYCGFHAGLRYEEIVMFKPNWIDREVGDSGVIHVMAEPGVWEPKDREERTIPLSPEFRDFLDNQFPREPGPYMIAPHKVKRSGERYRVEFRTKFENFVARNGFNFTRHDMRRSFASNLVSAGKSIYKVSKWLGDDVQVVQKSYGHLDPSDTDLADVFGVVQIRTTLKGFGPERGPDCSRGSAKKEIQSAISVRVPSYR